jgi:hypothetical protein
VSTTLVSGLAAVGFGDQMGAVQAHRAADDAYAAGDGDAEGTRRELADPVIERESSPELRPSRAVKAIPTLAITPSMSAFTG